jgi:hypothetical protein
MTMTTLTTWGPTALAVALAVAAAFGFAYGAFVQQRVVAGAATGGRVGIQSFRKLARQPRWLLGWAMIAASALLHGVALLLAPVSVVQPIGILAVPVAVLLAARHGGARPGRTVTTAVALSVVGTGAFVILAGSADRVAEPPVTVAGQLTAVLIVGVVTACLAILARKRTGLVRCLGYASIGAVSFGFGSALIHLIGQEVTNGSGLLTPLVVIAGLSTALALAVGAWAVQQAYAAGPSAVVVGVLTVGDPLVAILLSAGLLGGGLSLAPAVVAAMVVSAAVAAVGVRLLASHHPDSLPSPSPEPVRDLASVS